MRNPNPKAQNISCNEIKKATKILNIRKNDCPQKQTKNTLLNEVNRKKREHNVL